MVLLLGSDRLLINELEAVPPTPIWIPPKLLENAFSTENHCGAAVLGFQVIFDHVAKKRRNCGREKSHRSLLIRLLNAPDKRALYSRKPRGPTLFPSRTMRGIVRIAPRIDGELNVAVWQVAKPVTLHFSWANQTGKKQKTVDRLTWQTIISMWSTLVKIATSSQCLFSPINEASHVISTLCWRATGKSAGIRAICPALLPFVPFGCCSQKLLYSASKNFDLSVASSENLGVHPMGAQCFVSALDGMKILRVEPFKLSTIST